MTPKEIVAPFVHDLLALSDVRKSKPFQNMSYTERRSTNKIIKATPQIQILADLKELEELGDIDKVAKALRILHTSRVESRRRLVRTARRHIQNRAAFAQDLVTLVRTELGANATSEQDTYIHAGPVVVEKGFQLSQAIQHRNRLLRQNRITQLLDDIDSYFT